MATVSDALRAGHGKFGLDEVAAYRLVGGKKMGNQLRLRRFEPEPDDPAVRERVQNRAFNRRVFREMIKGEIRDGGLSRRQRKELIRFAESLGFDTYEAYLLLRAVEYECCIAGPAAKAGILSRLDASPLDDSDRPSIATVVVFLLTAVLIGAMVIRAVAAFSS